jgi:riboflavin kinase / FMN adenylyltransferase
MSFKPQEFGSAESARLPELPVHLAVGMFDGVHLGHRAVIESAVQSARRSGGLAGVLTFHPHPSTLFRPGRPTRLILPGSARTRLLFSLGVDFVIVQPFTPDFARIPAEGFLPWLRRNLPGTVALYVGQNWRFGAGREGDVPRLVKAAGLLGLSVFSAPAVNYDGHSISSTRIRDLISEGRVSEASALLGYTYFAEGVVQPGRRLGRTIGFPTLNLRWSPELAPRFGVYAVRVGSGEKGGEAIPGVANYGVRPTVEDAAEPLLETHLLGACPFGEGSFIRVEWLRFLRPEMKFAGIDDLKAQIARDAAAARQPV